MPRWCADLHPLPDPADPAGAAPGTAPHRAVYLVAMLSFLLAAQAALASGPSAVGATMFALFGPGFFAGFGLSAAAGLTLLAAIMRYLVLRGWSRLWTLAGILPAAAVVIALYWGEPEQAYLRACRSMSLSSGASAALPLAVLLLAIAWWCWSHALRFVVLEDRRQSCPDFTGSLTPLYRRLAANAAAPLPGWGRATLSGGTSRLGLVITVLVFGLTLLACGLVVTSLESSLYDSTFCLLAALATALLAGSLYQFWAGWHDLRRFLTAVDLHPVRKALSDLQQVSFWSLLWQTSVRKRNYILQKRGAECAARLRALERDFYPGLSADVDALDRAVTTILDRIATDTRESRADLDAANEALAKVADGAAARLHRDLWRKGSSDTLDTQQQSDPAWRPPLTPAELRSEKAHLLAAEFIALRIAAFIRFILLHLRNLFSIVTVTFILSTVALLCYPFRGESLFRGLTLASFLAVAAASLTVFTQMQTDATLSRLTNTREGQIEPGFILRLVSIGALPLLAVLASVFPALRAFLFSWIQPALAALH